MSRDGSIEFDWADGTYRFRLGIGELRQLQERCDAGPAWIYARIEANMYRVDDLVETIRLGLIGGGKTPDEARKLARTYAENRPLHESILPAMKILAAAIAGPEDEPLKKEAGATVPETIRSQTESSGLPATTETAW